MSSKVKKVIRIISFGFLLGFVLLIAIAYLQYRDFKKVIVARLASQATSFIGQEVFVGDLSFSTAGEIILHSIIVHNPEGFTPGKLLAIKTLSLKMYYRDILKKKLFFEKITVHSPELTLMQNSEGRLNISDKLREIFARKPTLNYRIDEFVIASGIVDFNGDRKFRNDNLNLSLKNLSSERDTKTSISGHTRYTGSEVAIEGWVYLKNEPKRLSISISSQDMSLSALKESLNRYGMEITKTKAVFSLNAEGDTEKGFRFISDIGIKDAKFTFLKRDVQEIRLKMQAFLNITGKTLVFDTASLNAGGITAITGKGELRQVNSDFLYTAGLQISMLDLSAINFMKDLKMSGIVNSENLSLRGSLRKTLPSVSGDIHLEGGAFETPKFNIGQVNADMKFTSHTQAALDISLKDFRYGGFAIPWLQAKSDFMYRDNTITLNAPEVKSPDFTVSSTRALIGLPAGNSAHVLKADVNGMHASYPEQKAGVRNAALSVTISRVKNFFAGSFDIAADEIMFRQVRTGFIKGGGSYDDGHFSVDIPRAHISGGNIVLAAAGKTAKNIFPITVKASADNINLENLSNDIVKISNRSYPLSGNVKWAVFEGTIDSVQSVHGKASLKAEKIATPDRDNKRTMIKDGILTAEIEFRGNDLDIRADAGAGKISAHITGAVRDFGQKNRSGEFKIAVPEVEIADIRETLWEVFPNSLLYVGMDGSLSSDMVVQYAEASTGVTGTLTLNDIVLTGENGEYAIGPVNGVAPVLYSRSNNPGVSPSPINRAGESDGMQDEFKMLSFEKKEYQRLSTYYAQKPAENGYSLITIGSLSYGFPLLDAIQIWIRPEGNFLRIGRFSGNIFGGRLNGSAIINLSDVIQYRGGFLIEGLSLTQLCDRIEPIRGYITGKVNGIAALKGEGAGVSQLIGKADFWTYSTSKEKTKISREFLHKIGGPSLKLYLGDRAFDKGIMSLYLQGGYMIFRELEISSRNIIGMKDLDIKVAPLNNRISLDHLMWSITEAAYRAEKK